MNWLKNVKILWGLIGLLMAGLIYLISLVRSYEPEMNRLRLENIRQDSTITYQRIVIDALDNNLWSLKNTLQNHWLTNTKKEKISSE
jgi:hypothetical protein